MGKDSGIQWCHHTFNPWWGCEKISAACRSCYAESFAKRVGQNVWGGGDSARRFFGDSHWNDPVKWNRAAQKAGERHRVFCASMADVFEDRRDLDETRARLFKLVEATPALDWMLLSKRWGIADVEAVLPSSWREAWPFNAWAGATVEDQEQAGIRLPSLRAARATIRFISVEPMLEDLGEIDLTGVSLVIIGGESGHRARPLDLDAVDRLIRRAWAAGAWPFVKQMGEAWSKANGAKDNHGGDPDEWEPRFRVRDMPRSAPSPKASPIDVIKSTAQTLGRTVTAGEGQLLLAGTLSPEDLARADRQKGISR